MSFAMIGPTWSAIGSNERRPTNTSSEKLRPLPLRSASPSFVGIEAERVAERHRVVGEREVRGVERVVDELRPQPAPERTHVEHRDHRRSRAPDGRAPPRRRSPPT